MQFPNSVLDLPKRYPLAYQVVTFLNECYKIDPDAIKALFAHRVAVNDAMADHPTVQVTSGDPPTMSILGLLNGFVGIIPGTDSIGYVCGDYDDEDHDNLLGFSVHPKAEFEAKDGNPLPVP
jgi:hypothetical protein